MTFSSSEPSAFLFLMSLLSIHDKFDSFAASFCDKVFGFKNPRNLENISKNHSNCEWSHCRLFQIDQILYGKLSGYPRCGTNNLESDFNIFLMPRSPVIPVFYVQKSFTYLGNNIPHSATISARLPKIIDNKRWHFEIQPLKCSYSNREDQKLQIHAKKP